VPLASAVTLPCTPEALLKLPEGKRTRTVHVAPGWVDALIAPQLEVVIVTKREVGAAVGDGLGLGATGGGAGAEPSGLRTVTIQNTP